MKLKIIGRGNSPRDDWKVVNADTGEILEGVSRLTLFVDANAGDVSVSFYINRPEVDVEIENAEVTNIVQQNLISAYK